VTAVIADDDVRIALQPITDMRGEVVLGMEALSRFPPGPLPHPGAWFAAAHHAGVGVELEVHAIAKALDLLPALDPEVFLSLNVSPATLMADLPSLLPHDVPWGRIVLELTEHVPVQDYPPLNLSLAPMRRRRSRLAIDDTGAGFASLRHIANLAPDVIKLDIAIVSGVDTDPTRHALAEMLSRFGERMAIEVVAEGVETEAQRASLLALGVTRGQGFLLGRPEVWA
jgi:EAL domain-containing protein (putative c-di-GMP-specific phosphodiesterase class I)